MGRGDILFDSLRYKQEAIRERIRRGCLIGTKSYANTIRRLAAYKYNLERINIIIKELGIMGVKITPTLTDMPHGSGISDATGDLASRVGDKYNELIRMQNEKEILDYAVSMLSDIKRFLIDLKYMQDNKDVYVQSALKKRYDIRSRDTYYRLKDEAVKELARMLGETQSDNHHTISG